jgi:hypothetical protein
MRGTLVCRDTRSLMSPIPRSQLSSLHLDGLKAGSKKLIKYVHTVPWRLEVNHRPAFMIAIPGSDVASNVHNMRGLQYTQEILLLFPPFKINLVQLRSLYSILFPKCGFTRLNV